MINTNYENIPMYVGAALAGTFLLKCTQIITSTIYNESVNAIQNIYRKSIKMP